MIEGPAIESLELKLKLLFGLESFRLGQKEIIESALKSNDVLAVMPTGGGKSLCFQLPALIKTGVAVIVSPLIALMNDQVKNLKAKGIPAGSIHSGMSLEERKLVFQEMRKSESFLLYLSPERTQSEGFLEWLKEQKISLIAIDEAHCVSQWGHDFRPEYAQLKKLKELKPDTPMIALTATATPLVKNDIIKQLGLKKTDQHVYGFYRPNLYYQVEFCETESEKENFVLAALKKHPKGRVLIYCGTRKKVEACASYLKSQGYNADFYHAGLTPEKRKSTEGKYKNGEIRILAATNAFGMGIDHPDVRLVVHTQVTGNIESYYQEIGRAGRDGKDSTCLLVYSKKDKGLQSFFIQSSRAPKGIKNMRWDALNAMMNYAEGSECRHGDILTYFKDVRRIKKCGHCDSCEPNSARKIEALKVPTKTKTRKKKLETIDLVLSDDQTEKLSEIREWRRLYAREKDIPAFMVFGDKTLTDLIVKHPKTHTELETVYGLGKKKVKEFGEPLIRVLRA